MTQPTLTEALASTNPAVPLAILVLSLSGMIAWRCHKGQTLREASKNLALELGHGFAVVVFLMASILLFLSLAVGFVRLSVGEPVPGFARIVVVLLAIAGVTAPFAAPMEGQHGA